MVVNDTMPRLNLLFQGFAQTKAFPSGGRGDHEVVDEVFLCKSNIINQNGDRFLKVTYLTPHPSVSIIASDDKALRARNCHLLRQEKAYSTVISSALD